jgi:uncharacterized protein YodC (DUF2158 family)
MDELRPGMVVRLRSGGPAMTVGFRTGEAGWMCVWFDSGRELLTQAFTTPLLEVAEPDVWPLR